MRVRSQVREYQVCELQLIWLCSSVERWEGPVKGKRRATESKKINRKYRSRRGYKKLKYKTEAESTVVCLIVFQEEIHKSPATRIIFEGIFASVAREMLELRAKPHVLHSPFSQAAKTLSTTHLKLGVFKMKKSHNRMKLIKPDWSHAYNRW